MNRLFEHAGGMLFYCAAFGGGLACELCLDFGCDVNGDRHAGPSLLFE